MGYNDRIYEATIAFRLIYNEVKYHGFKNKGVTAKRIKKKYEEFKAKNRIELIMLSEEDENKMFGLIDWLKEHKRETEFFNIVDIAKTKLTFSELAAFAWCMNEYLQGR